MNRRLFFRSFGINAASASKLACQAAILSWAYGSALLPCLEMMNRRSRSTTSLILELADDSSSTFSLVDEFRRRGAASKKRPLSLAQTSRTSAAASLRRRHEAQHREERQPPPPLLEPLEPMRWSSKVGSRAVRHEPREPQHFEHPTALASSALEVQAAPPRTTGATTQG